MVVLYQIYQRMILFFIILQKKKMRRNERKNIFLMNGDIFLGMIKN